jgi:hypothetical protein
MAGFSGSATIITLHDLDFQPGGSISFRPVYFLISGQAEIGWSRARG